MARGAASQRREPTFAPSGFSSMFLRPEDRPVPDSRRAKARSGGGGDRDPKPSRSKSKKKRGRSFIGGLFYWGFVLAIWGVIGVGGLVAWHATKLPPIDQLSVPKRPPNIAILASDGSLLANRGETGGRTVTLKELPPYLPKAFIAIEDHRFYSHYGVDPVGIARALVRNVVSRGGGMQGGSTLTQQLAKNLFLTQERTASRKIQEAILSIWLERTYSKDQILELYLNRVYFGSGAYGVEAAAQKYFSKSARAVTLSEAAILAGLVQAPSRLAPNRNPDAAQARAELVLNAMAREGFADAASVKVAIEKPANAVRPAGAGSANYAADYVMDVLDDFIGRVENDVVVQTTIEPALQSAAEKMLTDDLNARGGKFNVSQGAIVAITPDGGVRALVGGRNYSESQFNRAVAARRQPGSSFKPFVYLTALESGLTPETVRDDSPVNIRGWQPENYSRTYSGPVSLAKALALSLNTIAVKLAQEVGPKNVVRVAQRLGIHSPLQPNASLALGTSEVAPIELVSAYAPFANGGSGVIPYIVVRVKSGDGKVIYNRAATGFGKVVDPDKVAMMNAMMRQTLTVGTARKAELPGWEAAGKTGTTQDFRDAWFVGYTSHLVAAVWLGNDDNSPTKKVTGGNLPVEIWSKFMRAAHQNVQPTPLPGGRYQLAPVDGEPSDFAPVAQLAPIPPSARARVAPVATDDRVRMIPQEKGILEKLFGG
ncbi:transglycosylase domain-containing protein [Terrirubrum flagellatum]|uniref:transglycosylase domain-containing protein n=1 Tax=Terrirubrum flagellatum TaxID=2895980 RepID=UPI003CC8176D